MVFLSHWCTSLSRSAQSRSPAPLPLTCRVAALDTVVTEQIAMLGEQPTDGAAEMGANPPIRKDPDSKKSGKRKRKSTSNANSMGKRSDVFLAHAITSRRPKQPTTDCLWRCPCWLAACLPATTSRSGGV